MCEKAAALSAGKQLAGLVALAYFDFGEIKHSDLNRNRKVNVKLKRKGKGYQLSVLSLISYEYLRKRV